MTSDEEALLKKLDAELEAFMHPLMSKVRFIQELMRRLSRNETRPPEPKFRVPGMPVIGAQLTLSPQMRAKIMKLVEERRREQEEKSRPTRSSVDDTWLPPTGSPFKDEGNPTQ